MENKVVNKIGALEVDGNIELWNQSVGLLALNWDGNIQRVLLKKNTHPSWFEPIDKSGIPLYGFDREGHVICGLCASETDIEGKKYPDEKTRIIIVEIDRTDDYGWEAARAYTERKERKAKEAEEQAKRKEEVKKAQEAEAVKLKEQKAKEKAAFERAVQKEVEKRLAVGGNPPAEAPAEVPAKRKRGRPRKNPLPTPAA